MEQTQFVGVRCSPAMARGLRELARAEDDTGRNLSLVVRRIIRRELEARGLWPADADAQHAAGDARQLEGGVTL